MKRRGGRRGRTGRADGADVPEIFFRQGPIRQGGMEPGGRRSLLRTYRFHLYALLSASIVILVIAFVFAWKLLSGASDTSSPVSTARPEAEPPPGVGREAPPPRVSTPQRAQPRSRLAESKRFQAELKKLIDRLASLTERSEAARRAEQLSVVMEEVRELCALIDHVRRAFPEKAYEWDATSLTDLRWVESRTEDLWVTCIARREQLAPHGATEIDAQRRYVSATQLMHAGKWEQASDLLNSALEVLALQEKGEVLMCLAICDYRLGRRQEARVHLWEGLHKPVGEPELLRASNELRALSLEPAVGGLFYATRLAADPGDVDALLWLSVDRIRKAGLEEAAKIAQLALDKDPKATRGHRLLAMLHATGELQGGDWKYHARACVKEAGESPFAALFQALLDSVDPGAVSVARDLIVLKPGVRGEGRLEGRIVEETDRTVTIAIDGPDGMSVKRKVSRKDIRSITRGVRTESAEALEAFRERFRALELNQAEQLAQLGEWCEGREETGIRPLALPLFLQAVELSPRNARAVEGLQRAGYVRDDWGEWVEPIYAAWPGLAEAVGDLAGSAGGGVFPSQLEALLGCWVTEYSRASLHYVRGLVYYFQGQVADALAAFHKARACEDVSDFARLVSNMVYLCESGELREQPRTSCTYRGCAYGRIPCRGCDEEGYARQRCSRCRGYGRYSLTAPKGTRVTITCPTCIGTGTREAVAGSQGSTQRCPRCRGSGKLEKTSQGAERSLCEVCRATGHMRVPCPQCSGTAWVDCPACLEREQAQRRPGHVTYGPPVPLPLYRCRDCQAQGLLWKGSEGVYRFCPQCGGAGHHP